MTSQPGYQAIAILQYAYSPTSQEVKAIRQ